MSLFRIAVAIIPLTIAFACLFFPRRIQRIALKLRGHDPDNPESAARDWVGSSLYRLHLTMVALICVIMFFLLIT